MSDLIKVLKPAALLALFVAAPLPARAQTQKPTFDAVAPLLKTYCASCHGGDEPKGELNLASLDSDFASNQAAWKNVFERLNEGSMPPKNKPQPTAAERKTILSWVASGLEEQFATGKGTLPGLEPT